MNDGYANDETDARGYWYGFPFYGTACFDGKNPMTEAHFNTDQEQYDYYDAIIQNRLAV